LKVQNYLAFRCNTTNNRPFLGFFSWGLTVGDLDSTSKHLTYSLNATTARFVLHSGVFRPMSSSPKQVKDAKIGVQISKATGGAYADVREVIESELARIREEWNAKDSSNVTIRNSENNANVNRPK
jgi:hypothetical protein